MKFIHRLGYYLGGFSIGLIILAFFLSGKKTSCDYSPEARVLKNLRIKERTYTAEALEKLRQHQIDTAQVSAMLHSGDVDFRRSDRDRKPCNTYMITGSSSEKKLELLMENCDSLVTVQEIVVLE